VKSVNKDKLLCLYSFETKGDVYILHRLRKGISLLAICTAADMPALQRCSHDSYLMDSTKGTKIKKEQFIF
jgi:hypothetical protein